MSTANGFLGEGDISVDLFNTTTGAYGNAYQPFGEADKFQITTASDVTESVSKGRNKRGQIVASVAVPKPGEIEIVLKKVDVLTLKMGLAGTESALTQGSGVLTDEPITASLDKWVGVGKRNLATAGLLVENSAGSATYVPDTDYVIDYRLGKIMALSTGAITAAQALKFTANYSAVSGSVIKGGTQAQIRARILFNGRNLVDGSDAEVEVWEAVVAPTQPIDFLSDKMVDITLKGRMVTPTGKDSAFEVRLPLLA